MRYRPKLSFRLSRSAVEQYLQDPWSRKAESFSRSGLSYHFKEEKGILPPIDGNESPFLPALTSATMMTLSSSYLPVLRPRVYRTCTVHSRLSSPRMHGGWQCISMLAREGPSCHHLNESFKVQRLPFASLSLVPTCADLRRELEC